ncbi:MAG TPA: hypothetical protein VD908_05955 [Cytophagales bacterium]|nr:hypothetical protein [Cytophagales bacterium]
MPSVLFAIIQVFSPFILSPYNHPKFILIVFISSFLIPVLSVAVLYKTGAITSFVMNEKSERAMPFAFTAVFYWIITYMFFDQFGTNKAIVIIIIGVSVIISLVAVINFFWKISAHSAGIAGVIGLLFALNFKYPEVGLFYPILILIVISGFIMSARLRLQVHNLKEILLGGLLGFSVNFIAGFFLI